LNKIIILGIEDDNAEHSPPSPTTYSNIFDVLNSIETGREKYSSTELPRQITPDQYFDFYRSYDDSE